MITAVVCLSRQAFTRRKVVTLGCEGLDSKLGSQMGVWITLSMSSCFSTVDLRWKDIDCSLLMVEVYKSDVNIAWSMWNCSSLSRA
jgi:hypothetical protein